jgi:hypothetical protein
MGAMLALAIGCGLLTGCAVNGGTGQSCEGGLKLMVSPATGTADHTQAAPGDQVKFASTVAPTAPPGCAVPQWLLLASSTWTSTDAKDIQISSANDATNGLATCVGPTNGAATVTATFTLGGNTVSGTSSLTCK